MVDREISLPFRLDAQGRVAATSDPLAIAKQHITSYLLTRPGERVMRPDFGTRVRDLVFDNIDPLQFEILTTTISDKVARDVSGLVLQRLGATEGDSGTSSLSLTVEFSLTLGAGQGDTRSTTISMGGVQ